MAGVHYALQGLSGGHKFSLVVAGLLFDLFNVLRDLVEQLLDVVHNFLHTLIQLTAAQVILLECLHDVPESANSYLPIVLVVSLENFDESKSEGKRDLPVHHVEVELLGVGAARRV